MGKRIALSNGRRLVDDILRVAARLPNASITRDLDLDTVYQLRKQIRPRLSWNVIMMKAYAMVAAENPALRQVYVGFPWPHVYEHDENVCLLTVAKEHRGESRLLFARFASPEEKSLTELNEQFEFYRRCDLNEVKQFRHQVAFARAPFWFRRMVWRLLYTAMPKKRANNMGTFGMSVSRHKESCGTSLLGAATTMLGVDHLPRRGISRVLYTFDHRILDGIPAVDMVEQTRAKLVGPIVDELREMVEAKQATAA